MDCGDVVHCVADEMLLRDLLEFIKVNQFIRGQVHGTVIEKARAAAHLIARGNNNFEKMESHYRLFSPLYFPSMDTGRPDGLSDTDMDILLDLARSGFLRSLFIHQNFDHPKLRSVEEALRASAGPHNKSLHTYSYSETGNPKTRWTLHCSTNGEDELVKSKGVWSMQWAITPIPTSPVFRLDFTPPDVWTYSQETLWPVGKMTQQHLWAHLQRQAADWGNVSSKRQIKPSFAHQLTTATFSDASEALAKLFHPMVVKPVACTYINTHRTYYDGHVTDHVVYKCANRDSRKDPSFYVAMRRPSYPLHSPLSGDVNKASHPAAEKCYNNAGKPSHFQPIPKEEMRRLAIFNCC